MHSKNVRLAIFVGACLILLGVIFFKNNAVGDKFAQANALMSRLQSSALYTDTLTDSELTLLKTTREESQTRITLLTTTINSDTARAKGMIAEVSLQAAILDNFTLRAPRSYFINNVDNKLGILSTNTELKTLLDSINKQVNDRNIRESFITWYDEFFATVCSTDDASNNINVRGTVTFQNGSANASDMCQGSTLVQTQCINRQNVGTVQTVCPNGCRDGVCIDAPTHTLKGFAITLVDTITINTATGISISAIKNDNSTDTTYDKQVIILVDGDPNATFPLTAQTLANGTLTLDNALKFKSAGPVTVTVKDIETGTESSKNIIVTDSTGSTTSGATTGTTTDTSSTTVTTTTSGTTTETTTSGSATSGTTEVTTSGTTGGTSGTNTGGTTAGTSGQIEVTCPQYTAPPADYCSDGVLVGGGTDANGCIIAPTCEPRVIITCPQYTAPGPDFCSGGQIISRTDENGCQLAPTCGPKLITGAVTIDSVKDCWFGDVTRTISLGELLNYQANVGTHSGLRAQADDIVLYGATAPLLDTVNTDLLLYEGDGIWYSSAKQGTANNATHQLSHFFVLRTGNSETRTWNIPASGIKFYGCFSRGNRPNTW